MRSKDAILRWWQNFFSAAEYFGQSGRIILKAVGNTGIQLNRGHAGVIETWRSSVVGERFCQVICGLRILRGQPRLRPRLIYDS